MKEIFEIHITGDDDIHRLARYYGIKTIEVELLKPNGRVLRTEHMTSYVAEYNNLWDCAHSIAELKKWLGNVKRIKVECPATLAYQKYEEDSLYLEAHFNMMGIVAIYPASRNKKKTEIIGTDRVFGRKNYPAFKEKWKDQQLELCLYDTFIKEDQDWFSTWEAKASWE